MEWSFRWSISKRGLAFLLEPDAVASLLLPVFIPQACLVAGVSGRFLAEPFDLGNFLPEYFQLSFCLLPSDRFVVGSDGFVFGAFSTGQQSSSIRSSIELKLPRLGTKFQAQFVTKQIPIGIVLDLLELGRPASITEEWRIEILVVGIEQIVLLYAQRPVQIRLLFRVFLARFYGSRLNPRWTLS